MPDIIRCIAWFPNGSKKIRMFPDDRWGVEDAVSWEWNMINGGAAKIEYFRSDGKHGFLFKKGTFYSSTWVPSDTEKEEKDDSGPTE